MQINKWVNFPTFSITLKGNYLRCTTRHSNFSSSRLTCNRANQFTVADCGCAISHKFHATSICHALTFLLIFIIYFLWSSIGCRKAAQLSSTVFFFCKDFTSKTFNFSFLSFWQIFNCCLCWRHSICRRWRTSHSALTLYLCSAKILSSSILSRCNVMEQSCL